MLLKSSLGTRGGQGLSKVEQKRNFNEQVASTISPGTLLGAVRYLFFFGTSLGLKSCGLGKDPFCHRF